MQETQLQRKVKAVEERSQEGSGQNAGRHLKPIAHAWVKHRSRGNMTRVRTLLLNQHGKLLAQKEGGREMKRSAKKGFFLFLEEIGKKEESVNLLNKGGGSGFQEDF